MENDIFYEHGEMSERFKEPVLKTGDAATRRGFESHSLRQKSAAFDRRLPIFTCYLLTSHSYLNEAYRFCYCKNTALAQDFSVDGDGNDLPGDELSAFL